MVSSTLTSSLLDTATGQLALLVRSANCYGQVVRIRSPKCTVGSGPNCTLRLRARGVGPLHCLIVRGQQSTVVRRWSADTLLNGQAFTDAPLVPGDRLSIGTVELEVLDTGRASYRSAPTDRDEGSYLGEQAWQAEREELQRQLGQRSGQLAALQAELEAGQKVLEEQRRYWETQQCQTATQAAEQTRQLAARVAELEAQGHTLNEQRQQWQTEREELQRQLGQRGDQLASLQAELETSQKAMEEERRHWEVQQGQTAAQAAEQNQQLTARVAELEAERDDLQKQLGQRGEQLASLQAELQTSQKTLEEERRHWEVQQGQTAAQAAQQNQQLAARVAELEAERDDSQKQLGQRGDQLASLQSELESSQKALDEQRRHWEAQQGQTAAEAAEQNQQLAARVAELEAQGQALNEQRQQWQIERDDLQSQLGQRGDQLASLQAELESSQKATDEARAQLAAGQQVWEEERRCWANKQEAAAAEAAARLQESAVEQAAEPETKPETPLACEKPSEAAPVSLADVLRKVGAAALLDEDSTPAEENVEDVETTPVARRRATDTPPAPEAKPAAPAHREGDDESIDDYMSRLMERLRVGGGGSGSPSQRPQSVAPRVTPESPRPAETQSREAKPAAVEKPVAAASRPSEPVEMAPRAVAPETQIGLSAMRELANLSAKSALGQHARRQLIISMRTKLVIAVMGAATAAWMLWLWGKPGTTIMTLYSGVAGLVVALFWGIQYAVTTGHLIVDKPGHVKWNWSRAGAAHLASDRAAEEAASSPPGQGG
jgi:hypothetical protein